MTIDAEGLTSTPIACSRTHPHSLSSAFDWAALPALVTCTGYGSMAAPGEDGRGVFAVAPGSE